MRSMRAARSCAPAGDKGAADGVVLDECGVEGGLSASRAQDMRGGSRVAYLRSFIWGLRRQD